MKTHLMRTLLLLCSINNAFAGNRIFVAPNGNDTVNAGTIESPFATIARAQDLIEPGDTVYLRGGTFVMTNSQIAKKDPIYASVHYLDKNGTQANPICYFAYNNEKVVFDLTKVNPTLRITAFMVKGSWLHFKGFEVVGTQVTLMGHTQSECFRNEGSNNIYENLSMHDGMAIGFYLTRGSNNLILNCDAYQNQDSLSENGKGGNTDGFGCHPTKGGVNNIFRGCRAWFNSDDGYDCISAWESVTFDHCWSFWNGFTPQFETLADGNGFKAGGWGKKSVNQIPQSVPGHLVQFCVAVRNRTNGFYSNHQIAGSKWYNNTAYGNNVNFNMLNRLQDNKTDVPGYNHVLNNNISFDAIDTMNVDLSTCDVCYNSFSLPFKISADDFVSLEQVQLTLPRKSDGSLPNITFLQLNKKSKMIDKGVKLGFPYTGKAPDLGAFEYKPLKK